MVDHTLRIVLPIFRYAFPGCQALFALDNAANHCSFKHDAVVAHKMNLSPGGKQPKMRDGWDYNRGLPQTMVFSDTHQELKLRGEPKGIEVVLRERGLWPRNGWRPDGFGKFLLRCPTADEREGCPPDSDGGCCARAMLAAQEDFREQKGRLEEELAAANQLCIFYPKFHCEMNFIEILVWSKMVFAGELQLFIWRIKGDCSQGLGLSYYCLYSPSLQTLRTYNRGVL
jgi:hypothetical protein